MQNIFERDKRGFRKIEDFMHLVGHKVEDIVLYDNSTEELYLEGKIILPRYCTIFEGNKDGVDQFRPYEFNPNRIIVKTYKGIVMEISAIE